MKGLITMATQQKILDPGVLREQAKRIMRKSPNGRYINENFEREYQKEYIPDPLWRHKGMADDMNHCLTNGGGMSKCNACDLKGKDKIIHQNKCKFFKEASFSKNCRFEVFDEYCWSTKAQDASKKG